MIRPEYITNDQFLQITHGDDWRRAHVTSFRDDPGGMERQRSLQAWRGGHYEHTPMIDGDNQFYVVSSFINDVDGSERRRKALFNNIHVVVADDVGTKIDYAQINKLPPASYILETSPGNFHHGYLIRQPSPFLNYTLDQATTVVDCMIEAGITTDGKDSGMKGVTRYVRLPQGYNRKSKYVNVFNPDGFKCRMIEMHEDRRYYLEELAEPFGGDINRPRAGSVGSSAGVTIDEHPVLQVVNVHEARGDGSYVIECPFLHEHTDPTEDYSTTMMTFADGKANLSCFHGHCSERPQREFMDWCREQPGWHAAYAGFFNSGDAFAAAGVAGIGPSAAGEGGQAVVGAAVPARLDLALPGNEFLIRNIITLTSGRGGFYNLATRENISSAAVLDQQFRFMHPVLEADPSKWLSFQERRLTATGLGWQPFPRPVNGDQAAWGVMIGNKQLINTYEPPSLDPVENENILSPWYQLLTHIYGEYASLVLDHMAFTLQYPQTKIRWQVLCHGAHRTGKSMTAAPLARILGESANVVGPEMMAAGWGDIWYQKKVVIVEEVMPSDDKRVASAQFNKLKTKLANDDLESLNIKGAAVVYQQSLQSMYLFSNHSDALAFHENDNKLLVVRGPDVGLGKAFYDHLGPLVDSSEAFRSAVYWTLLNRDVSQFSYGSLPVRTQAMFDMVKASRGEGILALEDAIQHAEDPFSTGWTGKQNVRDWLQHRRYPRMTDAAIKSALEGCGWIETRGQRKVGAEVLKTPRFWAKNETVSEMGAREIYDWFNAAQGDAFGN